MTKLKRAKVLSFERKLANSDAYMFSGKWLNRKDVAQWKPIAVREKAVRGTISNEQKRSIASNDAKLNAEVESANLQKVDVAQLQREDDTLKLSFSLRVLGNIAHPAACNDLNYKDKLTSTIEGYIQDFGFKELSMRYALNLANGRFLWRNRLGIDQLEVVVTAKTSDEQVSSWIYNGMSFHLRDFDSKREEVAELANLIESGLKEGINVCLYIDAYVRLGKGQEVFPSQELVLNNTNEKGRKSKFLYEVDGVAALHSQKVGNALRTIDDWYPGSDDLGPIAVEPYGAVTNRAVAYRKPTSKVDFYSLIDAWVIDEKELTDTEKHYVIANLVRGGVFSKVE